MKRTIKLKIDQSRVREKRVKLPPKPVKRSKYAEFLFKEGAGWSVGGSINK